MFGLGATELIIIAVIVFLIFGAKRLPDIGKGIGGAVKEFRNVKKDISLDENDPDPGKNDRDKKDAPSPSLEAKLAGKVLRQVPGVRKALDVKDKVDRVKKIIN